MKLRQLLERPEIGSRMDARPYLSSFTIVLGAEINAEMERQTRRDTTEGPQKPLGQRGAYAADTVGRAAAPKKDRRTPE